MTLIFKRKVPQTKDIFTFVFSTQEPIGWVAGQSIRLELPTITGSEERRFTISSAPHEKDVSITTRLSDSVFKQMLFKLETGQRVTAQAIEGSFIWEETHLKHVFVAAGIGITPFRSILSQRIYEGTLASVLLIYATRDKQGAFDDELRSWQVQYPQLRLVRIVGNRITPRHVVQHTNIEDSLVYISGPENMVNKMSNSLLGDYHMPKNQLKQDWFTGKLDHEV